MHILFSLCYQLQRTKPFVCCIQFQTRVSPLPFILQHMKANVFRYDVRIQAFAYEYAGFAFLGRQWYNAKVITNVTKDFVQAKRRRRGLFEFVSLNGSANIMIFRKSPSSTVDEDDRPFWHGVTTYITYNTVVVTTSAIGTVLDA